jgi:hypothetical protein
MNFKYNGKFEQVQVTRDLIRYINCISNEKSIFYITHALNIIGNYISNNKALNVCIIPDGMLNYIRPKRYHGTVKNLINTKIFCLICGFHYKKPKYDVYNSGEKKYKNHYYILRPGLFPARSEGLVGLTIGICDKHTKYLNRSTVVIGQVHDAVAHTEYIKHIEKIVIMEQNHGDIIAYKPHPFEDVTLPITDMLKYYGVKLLIGNLACDGCELYYSRIVGITSTVLFTTKLLCADRVVVAYPKNFWNYEHDTYSDLIFALNSAGVMLVEVE